MKTAVPEMILSRINRCRHCGREMSCEALAYDENPFCTMCLEERVSDASPRGGIRWRKEGHYAIAEVPRTRLSSARRHRSG